MPTRRSNGDHPSREVLDAAKQASTVQLLFRCGRVLNEDAVERLRRKTGRPVRAGHTALLPFIDLEGGTRLTEIANRAGVTKQAVAPMIDEMVAMGMLERVADPQDGRASLIRFSSAGRRGILEGLAVLRGLESELAEAIGERRMTKLHETLVDIDAWLTARPTAAPAPTRGKRRS